MTYIAASTLRSRLADTVNRVAYGKERLVLERRGKPVAVLVPVEDLERLIEMEDNEDRLGAERELKESAARGEKPVPWATIKRDLGL